MHDKTKSCKDCPDRTAIPNCHTTCEGYKVQQERWKKIRENRNKDREEREFHFALTDKITTRTIKKRQKKSRT
jgi:hypothetical protein